MDIAKLEQMIAEAFEREREAKVVAGAHKA